MAPCLFPVVIIVILTLHVLTCHTHVIVPLTESRLLLLLVVVVVVQEIARGLSTFVHVPHKTGKTMVVMVYINIT